jgi:hypothetical protein
VHPPIHLLLNQAVSPAPNDETALFRARGRELARGRRRAEVRRWFALVTPRTAGGAGAVAPTVSPPQHGRVPARPA